MGWGNLPGRTLNVKVRQCLSSCKSTYDNHMKESTLYIWLLLSPPLCVSSNVTYQRVAMIILDKQHPQTPVYILPYLLFFTALITTRRAYLFVICPPSLPLHSLQLECKLSVSRNFILFTAAIPNVCTAPGTQQAINKYLLEGGTCDRKQVLWRKVLYTTLGVWT